MSELYAKFEAYIQEDMNAEERVAFERALKDDPQMKEDFEMHKSLQLAIDTQVRAESLETIQSLKNDASMESGLNNKGGMGLGRFLIPVLLGLLALGMILFYMGKNKVDNDQLFLAYYVPPTTNIERGGANHSPVVRTFSNNAHKLVGLGNYEGAQSKFKECGKGGTTESKECQWFEALCALKLGRASAEDLFKAISIDNKNPYKEKAKEILEKM